MTDIDDKSRMTDKDFAVAMAELTALGLVKWRDDENLTLTDKGIDFALEVERKLSPRDQLILDLLFQICRNGVKDED